jgi:hypothetical protein
MPKRVAGFLAGRGRHSKTAWTGQIAPPSYFTFRAELEEHKTANTAFERLFFAQQACPCESLF